jgi:D-sedoheptulose 7-phosphate isomerase
MNEYVSSYLSSFQDNLAALPIEKVEQLIQIFIKAWKENRQIFVFGNGGSAANASHFTTDLGKGASENLSRGFRIIALNENMSWITAIGNDHSYEDIFVRQLKNLAMKDDIAMILSVSGNSPNIIRALEWASSNGVFTIALVGDQNSKAAQIANFTISTDANHYGRTEDIQMTICHMISFYFIERNHMLINSEAISTKPSNSFLR